MGPEAQDLAMLLVAEGEPLALALRERLVKQGLRVHDCALARVASTALAAGPDFVVLCGAAAEDGGQDVLQTLTAHPATAGLVVVVVGDPGKLTEQAPAYPHGLVGIVERSESADELAGQIAEVARELLERTVASEPAVLETTEATVVARPAKKRHQTLLGIPVRPAPGAAATSPRVALPAPSSPQRALSAPKAPVLAQRAARPVPARPAEMSPAAAPIAQPPRSPSAPPPPPRPAAPLGREPARAADVVAKVDPFATTIAGHPAVQAELVADPPEEFAVELTEVDADPEPTVQRASRDPIAAPRPVSPGPAAPAPLPFDLYSEPPGPGDVTPLPHVSGLPGSRSKRWLVIPVAVVGLGLLVGGALLVRSFVLGRGPSVPPVAVGGGQAASARPSPTSPSPSGANEAVPSPAVANEAVPSPAVAPEAAPPPAVAPEAAPPPAVAPEAARAPAPTGAALGPAPGEALEGSEVDPARLGIVPVSGPGNRRARARLFVRLLRDANQARRRERFDASERIYRRVLGMDPSNVRATAGLSLVHLDRERPADAILWAQRLVRLRSDAASHWVLLGDALRLGENLDAARRAYTRALDVEPRHATAQRRLRELPAP